MSFIIKLKSHLLDNDKMSFIGKDQGDGHSTSAHAVAVLYYNAAKLY